MLLGLGGNESSVLGNGAFYLVILGNLAHLWMFILLFLQIPRFSPAYYNQFTINIILLVLMVLSLISWYAFTYFFLQAGHFYIGNYLWTFSSIIMVFVHLLRQQKRYQLYSVKELERRGIEAHLIGELER